MKLFYSTLIVFCGFESIWHRMCLSLCMFLWPLRSFCNPVRPSPSLSLSIMCLFLLTLCAHVHLGTQAVKGSTMPPQYSVPGTPSKQAPGEPPTVQTVLPGTVKAARKRLVEIKRVRAEGSVFLYCMMITIVIAR